ncbi:DUF899 domain-containing protein [Rhizobium mongolense]|uniref:DUF899 domain-containing protein n=1 Tax=Rhizobium mongolense TaxID=57676 RepID=UPI001F38DD87|nr:DUF899 domain-containing protein [Rhizobium mongolense]
MVNGAYQYLDLVPKGRDEHGFNYRWNSYAGTISVDGRKRCGRPVVSPATIWQCHRKRWPVPLLRVCVCLHAVSRQRDIHSAPQTVAGNSNHRRDQCKRPLSFVVRRISRRRPRRCLPC